MTLAEQIAAEIAARVGVVALLGDEVYQLALDQAVTVPARWCEVLVDPASAAGVAAPLYRALFPFGAPAEWWGTELGRRLAYAGVAPDETMSTRDAATLLGLNIRQARQRFGSGEIPVRDVLDALTGVAAS